MPDEDLARRLQQQEIQAAEVNADLGHVTADLQEQVSYTFTDEGSALFNQIRAYRPRYYGPRREVDLTGQNLAQAVTSAFDTTTQHARNIKTRPLSDFALLGRCGPYFPFVGCPYFGYSFLPCTV